MRRQSSRIRSNSIDHCACVCEKVHEHGRTGRVVVLLKLKASVGFSFKRVTRSPCILPPPQLYRARLARSAQRLHTRAWRGARAAAMRRTPRDQYDTPAPDATTVRYLYGVIALAAEQRCKRNVPPQRTLELAPRPADTWHAPRRPHSRAPAACLQHVPEAQGGLPEPPSTAAYRAQAVLRPCCVVPCRRCVRARSTTPAWWASMGSGRGSAASRLASTTRSSRRSSTGASTRARVRVSG